jgi:uncharacterized phage-associated protein
MAVIERNVTNVAKIIPRDYGPVLLRFHALFHRTSRYTLPTVEMSRLAFRFNPQKFVQSLVFFSKSGITDLTKMKVHKLLFFADKLHLVRYGRPIIGDEYFALDHGPLPSSADDDLDTAEDLAIGVDDAAVRTHFGGYLTLKSTGEWPVIAAVGPENYEVFSRSELKVLSEVVEKFGRMSASKLRKLSHEDPAYALADKNRTQGKRAPMPYESFFEGEADKAMLEVAAVEQEDRDFAAIVG